MSIPQDIGNYRRERLLGRGGSSEVWLARHLHLRERLAAVKVLMTYDKEHVTRFVLEARLTSHLRHPAIVQIFDHGHYPPFYCTVMEYLPDGALRAVLEQRGRVAPEAALCIFRAVAEALDFAHQRNVIHRDVSPGNILLEWPAAAPLPTRTLLTDFGIARQLNQKLTTVRTVMGTPAFFSPEHVQGALFVTPQSDIFSLGVVLYQMLTGHSPWNVAPDTPGFAFAAPPALREHGLELPAEVDRVLQTLLAPDPAKRYQTAQAAADALGAVLERHTSNTVVVQRSVPPGGASVAPTFEAAGLPRDEVERVLGARLQRVPMEQAEQRARALREPQAVAALLDAWSAAGPLRLRSLGRLATLRKVSSRNIYFYQLHVLFEARAAPYLVEEPDLRAAEVPLEAERDEWSTPLAPAQGFANGEGTALVRGSAHVVACPSCIQGLVPCATCGGTRRVKAAAPPTEAAEAVVATPAEVLVPCSACAGRGGTRCERCSGCGRLLQEQAFRWTRRAELLDDDDAGDEADERWFRARCQPTEIYREQVAGSFPADWSLVPGLAELVEEARELAPPSSRVALCEASVAFVPATDVLFALADGRRPNAVDSAAADEGDLHRVTIYGFDNVIPNDWRFLNWDRALLWFGGGFCLLLAAVSVALLFYLRG